MEEKTYSIVCQEWEESERGWGVRPDGATLHLTEEDRKAFCAEYWELEKKRNPNGEVPDEYSRESGPPRTITVREAWYQRVERAKATKGLWLTRLEYAALEKELKAG